MRRVVAALVALILIGLTPLEARDEPLSGWFDLTVRGGEATLTALGIAPGERAFTLPILARALHDSESRLGLTSTSLARIVADTMTPTVGSARAGDAITIPAPLDERTWRELLPPAKTDDLFARLLGDRAGLLVAVALMSGDDSLRTLAARDRDLLRFFYREASGPLLLAARRLRIVDNTVVVPGGAGADVIWQTLVGESPSRVGPFIRALLSKDEGRLAWYFDTIGGLRADQLSAAWPEGSAQLDAARMLYESFRTSDPQWRLKESPLRRGVIDAWTVVTQPAVTNGQPAGPWKQSFWELMFADERVTQARAARALAGASPPLSLEWLTRQTLTVMTRERRTRFEMFRLAQRTFGTVAAEALPDVAVAISGLRQHRALLLALERMQVTDPATWATIVEAARHATFDADNQRDAVTVFQGVIALLERMRHVRTLDVPATERLLRSLAETTRADKDVAESVARWIRDTLVPALPALIQPDEWTTKTAYESTLLQALAGPTKRPARALEWEGLTYSVDVVAAELERLHGVRAMVPSPGLDHALRSDNPRDVASALTALVYSTALGDPNGPVSLSPDIPTRHDFGLEGTSLVREISLWAPPEERQGIGTWRVHGSLIGMDLGLSRLALRRVADQEMPSAPTLTLNDLGTLTRTAVVMSASDLVDAHRDELAAAIERGRQRIAAARTAAEFATLAREAGVADSTRELLPWILTRQRENVAGVFSLRDAMWLGKPQLSARDIDRWGIAADAIDGRRVTMMPGPRTWEDYAGRSEAGQITTQVPDVTLRLIEETARRKLPALLVPALLGFALEDYWHEVQARFSDDWFSLTRQAARLSSSRFEDYVAALTGNGPLRTQ